MVLFILSHSSFLDLSYFCKSDNKSERILFKEMKWHTKKLKTLYTITCSLLFGKVQYICLVCLKNANWEFDESKYKTLIKTGIR
jgi:hypothetical protein